MVGNFARWREKVLRGARELRDGGLRFGDRGVARGRARALDVGVDELDVRDADEAEDAAEIRLEEIKSGAGCAGTKITAARDDDDRAFAFREAFEAAVALHKRAAVAHDLIDPG